MKMELHILAAMGSLVSAGQELAQPVIVTAPQWQTNAVGSTVTFSVEATGARPLFYQWYFNAAERAGATNETLVLTNVQRADQGNYSVVVTNVQGATSAVARLYVIAPPTISQHPTPTNQSVSVGATVTFSARAASSAFATTNYQWRRDGLVLSGRTNASLL